MKYTDTVQLASWKHKTRTLRRVMWTWNSWNFAVVSPSLFQTATIQNGACPNPSTGRLAIVNPMNVLFFFISFASNSEDAQPWKDR